MKKLFTIAAALLALLLVGGCNKTNEDIDKDQLIGSWEIVAQGIIGSDGVEDKVDQSNPRFPYTKGWTVTFLSDGTGKNGEGKTFQWSLSGNHLTVSYAEMDLTIEKLTATELVILGKDPLEEMPDVREYYKRK